jgi:hypothetical protein
LLALSTTTDIQKVCRLTSVQLDDIHCRHGESSTIDKTSDVSTDVDIVQIELFSVLLSWVVLGFIFLRSKFLLSEESV